MLRRSEAIEFSRIGTAIEAAIRTLPDNAHAALLLTAVDDLTEAEAADILGISEQTLAARVTAARRRIPRALPVAGDIEPDARLTQALIEAVVHRLANPPQPIPSRESLLTRVRRGARMLRDTWTTIVPRRARLPPQLAGRRSPSGHPAASDFARPGPATDKTRGTRATGGPARAEPKNDRY